MKEVGWCLIPPYIMANEDLSLSEKVLYGRILGLTKTEGYCKASNLWLGKQIGLSAKTINNLLNSLKKKHYLHTEYNGKLRKIYPLPEFGYSTTRKRVINTSISRSISNNLKVISGKSTKEEEKQIFGNTHVNRTLEEFEKLEGHEPLDRQPRQYAYNLVRRLEKLMRLNGKEPTPELVDKAISEYFRWIARKDWGLDIQKLETIFRKVPLFAAEKGLVWKEKK